MKPAQTAPASRPRRMLKPKRNARSGGQPSDEQVCDSSSLLLMCNVLNARMTFKEPAVSRHVFRLEHRVPSQDSSTCWTWDSVDVSFETLQNSMSCKQRVVISNAWAGSCSFPSASITHHVKVHCCVELIIMQLNLRSEPLQMLDALKLCSTKSTIVIDVAPRFPHTLLSMLQC